MTPVAITLLEGLALDARYVQASTPAAYLDIKAWIVAHGLDVEGPEPWKGGRRWVFRTCPWDSSHTNRSAYLVQFANGTIAAGCHHNGCKGKNWHALRGLVEPGWRSASERTSGAEGHRDDCRWEPPIPFHQIALPAFPLAALPGWLQSFVEAEATATQTPVDLARMLTLSVIAACCAKKVAVRVREGYVEPVNLFTATALPSGNRKTAVFAAVTRPLEDHERSEAQRTSLEISRQRAARQIKESILKRLKEQASSAKGKDQERLTQEAAAMAVELETTSTASPTRYIADDCTPERLATLLREQGGRIAVMSAEGDVFDLMAGVTPSRGWATLAYFSKGTPATHFVLTVLDARSLSGNPP